MRTWRTTDWRTIVASVSLALLLGGCCSLCPSTGPATAGGSGDSGDVCDPQPPPPPEDGLPTTSDTYVQAKASMYGSAGGGVFVQIDVGDPEELSPFTNSGTTKVWVTTGDTSLPALTGPPGGSSQVSSGGVFDLGTRHWGGGIVVERPGTHTELRIFVEVELVRDDGGPASKRWFTKIIGIEDAELPSGWFVVTAL